MNKEDFKLYSQDEILINRLWYSVFQRDKKVWGGNKYGNSRSYLIYVLEGTLRLDFTDGRDPITAPKDSAVFIPAGCGFISNYLEDGTTLKTFLFNFQTNPNISFDVTFFPDSAKVKLIFESIDANTNGNIIYLSAKVLELLALVKEKCEINPKKHSSIMPAIQELEAKYYENHKTSYYADLCGLSESHFRRTFKEITGKSFTEYKNDLRISYVKRIMETEGCSVTVAAYTAGFNNMSHFFEQRKKRRIKP